MDADVPEVRSWRDVRTLGPLLMITLGVVIMLTPMVSVSSMGTIGNAGSVGKPSTTTSTTSTTTSSTTTTEAPAVTTTTEATTTTTEATTTTTEATTTVDDGDVGAGGEEAEVDDDAEVRSPGGATGGEPAPSDAPADPTGTVGSGTAEAVEADELPATGSSILPVVIGLALVLAGAAMLATGVVRRRSA